MNDDKFKSRKYKALIYGVIVPQYIVLLSAIIMAFVYRIEMGFNFAMWFCGYSLVGILGYCGVNVWQKIKNHKNGGDKNGRKE